MICPYPSSNETPHRYRLTTSLRIPDFVTKSTEYTESAIAELVRKGYGKASSAMRNHSGMLGAD